MEDFVTYDIAQKLKKKGYPIKRKRTGILGLTKQEYINVLPTIYQVLKWLRDVKGIHIDIAIWKSKYIAMIVFIDKPDQNIEHYNETIWEDERLFGTYEQAAIAGIEYVLNDLI